MIKVDTTVFRANIRRYAVAAGKSVKSAIKEEAKLICERVMKFTPPKTLAQGRKRTKSDLERVYLGAQWFESTYNFQEEKLGERVKKLVGEKNEKSLEAIFENNNPRLNRIKIEPFDVTVHQKFRKGGRVGKGVAPFSFPLAQQDKVKTYAAKKQKNVGILKSGWAACLAKLGGSSAGWLNRRAEDGKVIEGEFHIIMINCVKFAAAADGKAQFAAKAIQGRLRDLAKKTEMAIKGVTWGR